MSNKRHYDISPCLSCNRVAKPEACENKNCRVWREWFSKSWDEVRNLPVLQKQIQHNKISTISIGGYHYAHPDQVREYLEEDPCDKCPFPTELCTSPCPSKRAWIEVRKEVKT